MLLLYALLLNALFLWSPAALPAQPNSMLGDRLGRWFNETSMSPRWLQVADIIMIYAQALLLNFTLIKNNILTRNTYLPAFFYVTFMALFPQWVAADLHTISMFFVLASFYSLSQLTTRTPRRESIFFTSLFLSAATLFYFPTVYFIVILALGLLLNTFALADIILLIMGLVVPYYFTGIYFYYQENLTEFLDSLGVLFTPRGLSRLSFSLDQLIGIGYMLLLSLAGYFSFLRDREFRIVEQRYLVRLMALYGIVVLLTIPLVSGSQMAYAQTLSLPCALFTARFFESGMKWWLRNGLSMLLLILLIFLQLYGLHIIG